MNVDQAQEVVKATIARVSEGLLEDEYHELLDWLMEEAEARLAVLADDALPDDDDDEDQAAGDERDGGDEYEDDGDDIEHL